MGTLCSDCAVQQFAQLKAHMTAYLRERGVDHELEKDEVPFAVLWPTPVADARSLRELGEQLRTWMTKTRGVSRILGLERLLEGERPEVAVELLGIPIPLGPMRPESWIESVALVVVENEVSASSIATSLSDVVERSGIAKVTSLEQYSWMNR